MKNIFILFSFISLTSFSQVIDYSSFVSSTDAFMKENVVDGLVNYRDLSRNKTKIKELTSYLKTANLKGLTPNQIKAFWINAYNLTVISSIVSKYPIKSTQSKAGFFDSDKVMIANRLVTINEIENKELREVFNDPRLHFVLVCGALGCPNITNFAYSASSLDLQLDKQTKLAMDNTRFIRVNSDLKKVEVSEIFNWYKADFGKDKNDILDFINKYKSVVTPLEYSVSFYEYDWRLNEVTLDDANQELQPQSNLQSYTPSVLLKVGQLEIKSFNSLYTQKANFDDNRQKNESDSRQTYFTSFLQTSYGLTPFINVGVDAQIKSVRNDLASSSPLKLFTFETSNQSRTALSYIGPKIKIAPTKRLKHLSVQSTFFIPVADDQQGVEKGTNLWLSHNGYQWWTQVFYDQKINQNFRAFFEVDAFIGLDKEGNADNNSVLTPAKAFLSYFPTNKITVYGLTEFGPSWGGGKITGYYTQLGVGGKYQLIKNLELELMYTNFPVGKNVGAGNSLNIGIRFLR